MKDKLHIGCGHELKEGYLNVDHRGNPDQLVDLSIYPWPWKDDSFFEVLALDLVEHILDTVGLMNEVWRVTKPDGIFFFRTPSYDAEFSYIDPTHVHHFHILTFDFFDPTTDFGKKNIHLTDKKWSIVSKVKTENKNLEFTLRKIGH